MEELFREFKESPSGWKEFKDFHIGKSDDLIIYNVANLMPTAEKFKQGGFKLEYKKDEEKIGIIYSVHNIASDKYYIGYTSAPSLCAALVNALASKRETLLYRFLNRADKQLYYAQVLEFVKYRESRQISTRCDIHKALYKMENQLDDEIKVDQLTLDRVVEVKNKGDGKPVDIFLECYLDFPTKKDKQLTKEQRFNILKNLYLTKMDALGIEGEARKTNIYRINLDNKSYINQMEKPIDQILKINFTIAKYAENTNPFYTDLLKYSNKFLSDAELVEEFEYDHPIGLDLRLDYWRHGIDNYNPPKLVESGICYESVEMSRWTVNKLADIVNLRLKKELIVLPRTDRIGIIYSITNLQEGKKYVGYAKDIKEIKKLYDDAINSVVKRSQSINSKLYRVLREAPPSDLRVNIIKSDVPADKIKSFLVNAIKSEQSITRGYNGSSYTGYRKNRFKRT